jgi:hypothetical protein
MDLKIFRNRLEQKKGERSLLGHQITESESEVQRLEREISFSEQAQVIIQTVARQTQKQLEYRVAELVSLAQAAVFDDPWSLKLDFVLRRGKTECDLKWSKSEDHEVDDLSYSGAGGQVDVAALGLQFAAWSLQRPKTRPVMFLDEPCKFTKGGDLPERVSLMIKQISDGLGLQIIMVSHISEQIEGADRVFEFMNRSGETEVKMKK